MSYIEILNSLLEDLGDSGHIIGEIVNLKDSEIRNRIKKLEKSRPKSVVGVYKNDKLWYKTK